MLAGSCLGLGGGGGGHSGGSCPVGNCLITLREHENLTWCQATQHLKYTPLPPQKKKKKKNIYIYI